MTAPRFHEIDTEPHQIYRIYSDGNFGEVAPERLSIMSWSLIGPPMERATRNLATRLLGKAPWFSGSRFVFLGYFGCRPYHNLASYCQLGLEVPGVRPEDVTASYFEGVAPATGLGRSDAGFLHRTLTIPRLAHELLSIPARLLELDSAVAELELEIEEAVEEDVPMQLGRAFSQARAVLDEAWDLHISTTSTLVCLRSWQDKVGRRLVDHLDEVLPWINRPKELVWSRMFDALDSGVLSSSQFLTRPFYEIADDHSPWDRYAIRARRPGVSEQSGQDALDPGSAFLSMLPHWRRSVMQTTAQHVGDAMSHREATKSLVMRTMHVFRSLIPVVASIRGVDDDAWPYVSVGELEGAKRAPGRDELVIVAKARRARVDEALATEMPGYLDLSTYEPAPTATSRERQIPSPARGVSPGTASGVVVSSSVDELPDADALILVCESADAEVHPLLPFVSGVVAARGSELSHIAILAREFGIPAVVGYRDAMSLKPGTAISVNGTTGEVRVETCQ